MGLFGSSKKKTSDPFQAAVEQQRKRTSAGTLRSRRSESAYHRNADCFRRGGPLPWQEGTSEHPYAQPGFGFYSGENLVLPRAHVQTTNGSSSMDDGPKNAQFGLLHDLFGNNLPLPPHPSYPESTGQNSWDLPGYDAKYPPWTDPDSWIGASPPGLPYHSPEEEFLRQESHYLHPYNPRTRELVMGRPSSSRGHSVPARTSPFNALSHRERPGLDTFRPFNNSHVASPYESDQSLHRFAPQASAPIWKWNPSRGRRGNSLSNSRTADAPPPRPPGSYERLRPLHLQHGNSPAESGRDRRGSTSWLGELRCP